MKNLIVLICVLFTVSSFAKDKDKPKGKFEPSVFEVTPLNSPVKGSTAKFSLKLPQGFEVDKVKVKLVNASDLKKDQKKFEDIKVVNNNELDVSVSKLPPGFYRLYVTVIDKGSKKEHEFKTNYHDFVRFVIDESMEVPLPDPKKDNATIAGVDSDMDGIPDRIQRWINETYATKPNIKNGLKQYARSKQVDLLSVDNKELSIIATQKTFESSGCMVWINGLKSFKKSDELISKFLNTPDRIKAELKGGQNFHGKGESERQENLSTEEEFTLCDFEASKEE